MPGPTPFISSCSRRQLARRRPSRVSVGRLALAAVPLAVALAAFMLGHGGI
jgi:hypothetical protein